MQTAGSLAEWSKALVLGTTPKRRGFESHSCQNIFYKLKSLQIIAFEIKAAMGVVVSKEKIDPVLQPNCFCCLQLRLQWRNRLAHGTYRQYKELCRGCEFEPHLEQVFCWESACTLHHPAQLSPLHKSLKLAEGTKQA